MMKRIIIAVAVGCGLTALSLVYGRSGVDAVHRGAPFQFLQIGMALSFENYYKVDYNILLLDVLVFSLPVWLILYFCRSRKHVPPTAQASYIQRK